MQQDNNTLSTQRPSQSPDLNSIKHAFQLQDKRWKEQAIEIEKSPKTNN